jgi:hypothetical protein
MEEKMKVLFFVSSLAGGSAEREPLANTQSYCLII